MIIHRPDPQRWRVFDGLGRNGFPASLAHEKHCWLLIVSTGEVAAVGGQNMLLVGPSGSGKTLLARALHSILPPMSVDEASDVTRIYSDSDQLAPRKSHLRQSDETLGVYTITTTTIQSPERLGSATGSYSL